VMCREEENIFWACIIFLPGVPFFRRGFIGAPNWWDHWRANLLGFYVLAVLFLPMEILRSDVFGAIWHGRM
jgi:hypothetical protein